MKLNMDLKTLIVIISAACVLAGFYYTTKTRLDASEQKISSLRGQIQNLKKEDKRLNRLIRNIKKATPR